MDRIENDLKAALRRKPVPPGFAARVMERIEENKSAGNIFRRFLPGRPWMLAAAALAAMAIGAVVYEYPRYIRDRNEAAFQDTLTAITIVTAQLDRAESRAFEQARWEHLGQQLTEFSDNDKR
jgi:hypothetical protein